MNRKPTYEELEQKIKDITDHKEAEEALLESKENFKMIFTYSSDGIIVADPETKKFLYVNPAICRMLGYTEEELTQMEVDDIHPKDSLEHVVSEFEAQARGEKLLAMDIPFLKKNGEIMYMDTNASLVRMGETYRLMGIFRDITDRKEAEEALRKSEADLAKAQQIAHLGNWNWDIAANKVSWSDELYRIVGVAPKELDVTYSTYMKFIHPDDLEFFKNLTAKVLKGKKPYTAEYRMVRPNNDIRIVHEEGEVIVDADGKPVNLFGTVQDITERKQMEAALQKAHDELEKRVEERTKELNIKNKSLEELNTAMKVLLEKRKEDKIKLEDNVLANIRELIGPLFDNMRETKLDAHQKMILSIVESNLNEITSHFTRKLSLRHLNLTPTEMKIANLIKHGTTSKKIAELMKNSPRTIETHRKNIREKVGLKHNRANLRSYLLSLH